MLKVVLVIIMYLGGLLSWWFIDPRTFFSMIQFMCPVYLIGLSIVCKPFLDNLCDALVSVFYSHEIKPQERWRYYSLGERHWSPGVYLRVTIYVLFYAPIVYGALRLFRNIF